ncbi:MAG: SH3 beta-barrel fold-containing protein [Bacteroidia bacterium]
MTPVNLNQLANLLLLGPLHFEYLKLDGTLRTAKGTLCKNLITGSPKVIQLYYTKEGNLNYYDLDANSWKTVAKDTSIAASLTKKDRSSFLQTAQKKVTLKTPVPVPPVISNGTITPVQLVDLLNSNIVKFKYEKPDGSKRIAYGTTDPSRTRKVSTTSSLKPAGNIPYYNIEQDTWKTIAAGSSIELVDVFDVPLKK